MALDTKLETNLETNKRTARRFLEDIWSQGSDDAASEILASDFVFLLGVDPYRVEGAEAFMNIVHRNRKAFQDLTYIPDEEHAVAEGDVVVYPWAMTAKHVEPWAGYSASNKEVAIKGMTHYVFVDGKISQAQVQNEALSLVRQIGGIPPIGEGTEYKVLEANKAAVRRYIEAFLMRGDFSNAEELVTPGFSIDRSAVPDAIAGPAGLQKQMEMLMAAFPDLELQIADMFAEGDKVAVRFIAPGTHRGEFAGVAPTGRKTIWKGIVIYRVEEGRVAEAWANWDDVGLIQSLQR